MNTEKKFTIINRNFHFAFFRKAELVINSFSLTEKIIFGFFIVVLFISSILILKNVSDNFLVSIPNNGGVINEGVIGTPRFINPVIAISAADKDLSALIYSGLTKKTVDGKFIPNIAENYEISEDGLEYRFYLRNNVKFHDGRNLTADDVIFTILKTREPSIESPKRSDWEGVEIEKISDYEIVFRLKQPHSPFIEKTTIGILPKHLWEDVSTDGFSLNIYNTDPIGTGPYKLERIRRDQKNIPTSYTLSAYRNYSLGEPFVSKFIFHFARNESELIGMFQDGIIDSMSGIRPEIVANIQADKMNLINTSLPRVFGIFFNQSEAKILADSSVRRALETAISKEEIINKILFGFGEVANDTVPPNLEHDQNLASATSGLTAMENEPRTENNDGTAESADDTETATEILISQAQNILETADWEKNENGIYEIEKDREKMILSFGISTSNVPELVAIAELVAEKWRAVGADVEVKIYEANDLNQNVIRPRTFEALLFGMVINKYRDLHAFWHSSQRLDPGLNITGYANITTDRILENLREMTDPVEIQNSLVRLNESLRDDRPALFLYTPHFIYIVPKNVDGINVKNISGAEDRFLNIHEWFIKTNKVWKIFN